MHLSFTESIPHALRVGFSADDSLVQSQKFAKSTIVGSARYDALLTSDRYGEREEGRVRNSSRPYGPSGRIPWKGVRDHIEVPLWEEGSDGVAPDLLRGVDLGATAEVGVLVNHSILGCLDSLVVTIFRENFNKGTTPGEMELPYNDR